MTHDRRAHLDEQALASRAVAGDEDAFSEIVHRYQGPVYRMCLRYTTAADAEDLAQETFLRAFVHRERFDPTRPLAPWLLTIARRLAIDRHRKHEPELHERIEDNPVAAAAGSAERDVIAQDRVALLARGLEELAEGPREAIRLFHLEGMAYKDIAATLDVPVGTVMTWLHRGRAKLKKLVDAAEQTDTRKDA